MGWDCMQKAVTECVVGCRKPIAFLSTKRLNIISPILRQSLIGSRVVCVSSRTVRIENICQLCVALGG